MDLLLYIVGFAVIGVVLVAGVRYALTHFSGTFNAWGGKHYDSISKGDNGDS